MKGIERASGKPDGATRRDFLRASATSVASMGLTGFADGAGDTSEGKRPDAADLEPIPTKMPVPGWPEGLTADRWAQMRTDIQERFLAILGPFPKQVPEPRMKRLKEIDCGDYWRIKISHYSEVDDVKRSWLLIPKKLNGPVPGVLALHSSTRGAGKDRVVGICGYRPHMPPEATRSYGITAVKAGYVVIAPDTCCDGESTFPGHKPRDTRPFYKKHPEWSYVGKIIWDSMRAVDVLRSLPEVDAGKIGVIGHSLGGHSAIFSAGFDERIGVTVANGAVSYWFGGLHWALPQTGKINTYINRLRPYLTEDKWRTIPVQWYEIMALPAPRPLLNMHAQGDLRPMKEENHGGARHIYEMLGCDDRLSFLTYPGGHNFPLYVQEKAMRWFGRWFDGS